ncbi:MAG: DUF4375 domain-containing protein [Parahaliea sp.]
MKLSSIVVSQESHNSTDPYDLIYSNIQFLNALFDDYVYTAEVSREALKSYYIDYYLGQVNNGGFSQFVYNTSWQEEAIELVREGLLAIGAKRNLALFEQGATLVDSLGEKDLAHYLQSGYFGENDERDHLEPISDLFFNLQEEEDLVEFNYRWLKQHPALEVLDVNNMQERIKQISSTLPDREERIQQALAAEPRYYKVIRALCAQVGQQLERVTAGDPNYKYQGHETLAWHFLTEAGHHYMVEVDGSAIMFKGNSAKQLCRIEAGSQYGTD